MPFIGGAILPHGALILDPTRPEMAGSPLGDAARHLHEGCAAVGRAIRAVKPDVVLLYTPHGLVGDHADLHVYMNASASGTCEWMGSWAEHRVSVKCDAPAAQSLLDQLKSADVSVEGITAFSGYDAPLRWGECVPLSFLRDALADGTRVVFLSHGPVGTQERAELAASRRASTAEMGKNVAAWAGAQEKRVFLLISGDLAHVHGNSRAPKLADGAPDPRYLNAKYDYQHPSAAAFEANVVRWVKAATEAEGVAALDAALALACDAMCCGIEGFLLLDAAMRHAAVSGGGGLDSGGSGGDGGGGKACAFQYYERRLLAHEVPVYYGMLAAIFLPTGTTSQGAGTEAALLPALAEAGALPSLGARPAKMQRTAASVEGIPAGGLPVIPRAARIDFAGKRVLVSGAGHGIGRAIAIAFAALGAAVDACDGPGAAAAEEMAETAALARGAAGHVTGACVDFRDFDAVRRWAGGRPSVDVLVLCAGGVLGHVGALLPTPSDAFRFFPILSDSCRSLLIPSGPF